MDKAAINYYYFEAYGRGELPRMILGYNQIKFEDVRMTKQTWPEIRKTVKFGQAPFIDIDGKQIAQGYVIGKYLCQKLGQYSNDVDTQIVIDEWVDFVKLDLSENFNRQWYVKDEVKKNYLDKFFNENLPNLLQTVENSLAKGNKNYLVGESITIADFALLEFAQRILLNNDWKDRCTETLSKLPTLTAYLEARMNDEGFKAYLKQRVPH